MLLRRAFILGVVIGFVLWVALPALPVAPSAWLTATARKFEAYCTAGDARERIAHELRARRLLNRRQKENLLLVSERPAANSDSSSGARRR